MIVPEGVMNYRRYAIYYTPPPGPLNDLGASWLGWDIVTGQKPPAPDMENLPRAHEALIKKPQRYGFHGTLMAPFRLSDGVEPSDLFERFSHFCQNTCPVTLPALALENRGPFLALCPKGDVTPLATLERLILEEFDPHRAALTQSERSKRKNLSLHQKALMERWGYPYVLDEFRFHITLTGRLKEGEHVILEPILAHYFSPVLSAPFKIDALSLVGEDESGFFHLITRKPLAGYQ